MKKHLQTILLVVVLLAGLALLLYPSVSNFINTMHTTSTVSSYTDSVSRISPEEYQRILAAARRYNEDLLKSPNPLRVSPQDWDYYARMLAVDGVEAMAYINIPKIECMLPIYHGTSDAVLQVAVGHLQGSSLPVGGASTHCVLSGHRGLPSAQLFSQLDKMEIGDTFTVTTLNEVLTYQVDEINVVLPSETENLRIVPGEDYCTLITCTPYGINSHRLLVRGTRIPTELVGSLLQSASDATRIDPFIVAAFLAAPMLLACAIIFVVVPAWQRRRVKKPVEGTSIKLSKSKER